MRTGSELPGDLMEPETGQTNVWLVSGGERRPLSPLPLYPSVRASLGQVSLSVYSGLYTQSDWPLPCAFPPFFWKPFKLSLVLAFPVYICSSLLRDTNAYFLSLCEKSNEFVA